MCHNGVWQAVRQDRIQEEARASGFSGCRRNADLLSDLLKTLRTVLLLAVVEAVQRPQGFGGKADT